MTKTTTTTTEIEYDAAGRVTKETKTTVESDNGGNVYPTAPWGQPRYEPPTRHAWMPQLWTVGTDGKYNQTVLKDVNL